MMKKYILIISILFFLSNYIPTIASGFFWHGNNDSSGINELLDNGEEKKDTVNIAFKRITTGNIVGAVSALNAPAINEEDNTIWVSEVFAGRTMGMLGNTNIRGIGISIDVADLTGSGTFSGNALFIVDGLPRDIGGLRMSEIENITVLKDVNAAILYGSAAINGVVLITTKRGKTGESRRNISVNYGISTPLELPEFLNSADYMTYHNRARINDGLEPQYSDEMIQNYRSGNKYRYPDVDYYSSEYVRSFRPYVDVASEFSGGNEMAKYYLNLGMNSVGSWLNFGEGANARNNVFNVRGNVDLKIIDWINTSIDATALFGTSKGARGNYFGNAATLKPHEYTPLIPIDLIDPQNTLLLGRKNDVNGQYLLGGNINQQTTPFGNGYAGGVSENIYRNFSFNNRINFDLGMLTEGLSFHTNLSFDYYTVYNQTVDNQYSVYEAVWDDNEDKIIDLKQYGKDARPGTQTVGGALFRRRIGFYGLLNYDRTFDDIHNVSGSLIGYGSQFKETLDFQGVKHAHLGLRLAYTYDNRYMVDFSNAYVNSVKLAPNNRRAFSPSLGLAWVMSSEEFLSSASNIDLLKFRLSGGILNSDLPIADFFYYDNRYGTSGSYNWYEGTRSRSGVMSNWGENLNLGFAKRKEVNIGVEGLFFDKMIGLNANFFYDIYSDLVVRPSSKYAGFYNDFISYSNFEKDSYTGLEAGVNFNKSFGDWNLQLGVNALYVTSERLIVDEVYADEYRYRKGYPKDATFGLEALGLFKDQADIDNSPWQSFGAVRPGDIKYKDQNGDGVIDGNDEVYLRRWQAPFSGGMHLKISYKNLTLFALGEGRSGADTFMEGDYYWVDGNDKYSEIVLNSWTPETASTATFPRLSSVSNNNNFRRSTFWLYNNDYFQIRKVQLTYKMPESFIKAMKMNDFDLFIDASNLYQFAKNKKIRETNVGGNPYSRTFSIGLRTKF
ncbi:SusC/RagA family TonB-linked outer membrane protein [Proteiniphilum acetatigenes]|uniref:SusC/RagA family TonB-linked outer membrane protein n=1 Tax=Proteiniphilum acetatigenes TaxID=294710 RepID=UPI00036528CB|nr:SusC/RagA family TonB-linked outer membrane protein [Proteiniphilum acetatigenes]